MSNRPDFATDLEELKLGVQEELDQNVSKILTAVKQKRPHASPPLNEDSQPTKTIDLSTKQLPSSKLPRGIPVKKQTREAGPRDSLVNVTTRLSRETKDLLTESALRQKLAKALPDSEQAIIEEALQQWFKRNTYKRRDDVSDDPASREPVLAE
jgi:hypothetical protein